MPHATVLSVTLTYAAALAVLNIWLALRCAGLRFRSRILTGSGGNPLLEARMRAQANFVEYTPFVLILMGLLELGGVSRDGLFWLGGAYTLARFAHAFGMDRGAPNPLRAGGAIVTWLVLLALAVWAFAVLFAPAPTPAVATRLF